MSLFKKIKEKIESDRILDEADKIFNEKLIDLLENNDFIGALRETKNYGRDQVLWAKAILQLEERVAKLENKDPSVMVGEVRYHLSEISSLVLQIKEAHIMIDKLREN